MTSQEDSVDPHPLVSVAITTRNYGRFLARALASALRAGERLGLPYEIVVSDDASTDETREVLERFRLAHPSIVKAVYRGATRGVAVAKNSAIGHCSGRYIALLDADDEFLPEKLRYAVAPLIAGEADFVTHRFLHWLGPERQHVMTEGSWSAVDVGFWPPSTWVFEKGVVWHNEQMFLGNDDLEWLARSRSTIRHHHLPIVLNIQYAHPNNFGQRRDSVTPSYQVLGRMRGKPNEDDRRAPRIWACGVCGRQTLLATTCCGRPATREPIFYYSIAESTARPPHPPEFSFVFLTKNHADLTRRAVESLLPQLEGTRSELIFIDGGSTDETLDRVRDWSRLLPVKLVCVHPEEPFNYSRCCNRGARAAAGADLILLNNDIEVCSGNLVATLRAALSDARVGVAGVATAWHSGQREPEWDQDQWPYVFTQRPPLGFLWGIRREVYWELGGMDEAFTGYGYDELDLEFRAIRAHYRLALVRSRVQHHGSVTYSTEFEPADRDALLSLNRSVFESKHGCAIYTDGDRVEPFAGHRLPRCSVVIVARDQGSALRRSLELAAAQPGAHDGSLQLVVVNNGSKDDTALALAEYRRRLPRALCLVEFAEPVEASVATKRGLARAIGEVVSVGEPGLPLPELPSAGEETSESLDAWEFLPGLRRCCLP